MAVASLVPSFLMGLITGVGIIGRSKCFRSLLNVLVSMLIILSDNFIWLPMRGIVMIIPGFFRLLPDLPKPFWHYPVSYINYGALGIQGANENDFLGLEFDPLISGDPKIPGEFVVLNIFGVPLDHSKWADLSAIYLVLVGSRIPFFIILKLKDRASPFIKD